MTKEERELRREQREHMKRMEAAAKEAGRGPIDVPFLLLVLLLTGVGLIMLLSASFPSAYYESGDPLYYFKRQAAFATLGLAAMVVIGRINYARFRGVAKIALGISIALLVAVIIPGVGITSHGATRWLGIPGTTMRFQPSEIAKLGVILYFADSISKKKDKMRTLRYGILPYGFILALIAVLMYFEPHLSGTVLILGIGAAMMFVGGIRGYWVGIGIGGLLAVIVIGFLTVFYTPFFPKARTQYVLMTLHTSNPWLATFFFSQETIDKIVEDNRVESPDGSTDIGMVKTNPPVSATTATTTPTPFPPSSQTRWSRPWLSWVVWASCSACWGASPPCLR